MGDRPRVCLTGAERSIDALEERLLLEADLHEVRLDYLDHIGDEVFGLIERHGQRLVVTCRPRDEGGAFDGSEAERLGILLRAKEARPAFLDVELSLFEAGLGRPFQSHAEGPTILVSCHGKLKHTHLPERFRAVQAQAVKVATPVDGAADLLGLLDLGHALRAFPTRVVIGMGPAGVVSRLRPHDFCSSWTYCAPTDALATAPGQLGLEQARALRLFDAPDLEPVYLVGGVQVLSSPGPEVYNRLFSTMGLPFQYLPLPAHGLDDALSFAMRTSARFFSVTMPFKTEAARRARRKDPFVAVSGAANTLCLEGSEVAEAHNTDALAAQAIFALAGLGQGEEVLILGMGGAGRAVGEAAKAMGAKVAYAARRPGPRDVIPWEDRHMFPHSVLVNCTPVGSDGEATPFSEAIRARMVLDLVMRRGDTRLVKMARAASAQVFSGVTFWAFQGAHQMGILTGRPFTPFMLLAELARGGWTDPVPKTIALIGMRGAGKTTVGSLLAKGLGWRFVDSDALVEERLGRSIETLFASGDVGLFRLTEAEVLREVLGMEETVVATGGGAVLDQGVRAMLGSIFTVWLRAPGHVLAGRIAGTRRPSLTGVSPEAEVQDVLTQREPLYKACATLCVLTDGKDPQEVCDAIIHAWNQLQGDHIR